MMPLPTAPLSLCVITGYILGKFSTTIHTSFLTLISRLTLLCSLMTLSWFVTAHILEYTSIKNCRHSSPHLWWLVFGILCTMYLLVLEVVLLGFIVLVLAPILFVSSRVFETYDAMLIGVPDILEYSFNLLWSSPTATSQYNQPRNRKATKIGSRTYPTRHIHSAATRRCKVYFGWCTPLLSPENYIYDKSFSTSLQVFEPLPQDQFHFSNSY